MFDTNKRAELVRDLKTYFYDELDYELEQFDAEFLLDFLTKKLGPAFYNKGLEDAKQLLERKLMDISDELYEIEMQEDS
ncbi:hypothetical protein VTH8203_04487 [Vibrio thalassae]|uniref:DUF2164 domain-containing protein n=1 Tax=Vibrio thalassae TaxID=1243014 RepID=A0A240ER33_9VIBR|nr:DUF2164 domain-containing protein [Vibrio thalassae]SNX50813.1 hypothetical protein VTH8203_04487 [Vibrio thalassae]